LQGELFKRSQYEELYPYWREQLKQWIIDAWHYRHARHTTGWSMATQGFMFARRLYAEGQISKDQFRRFFRFHRRIRHWDTERIRH
jgi:hypothetical protein